VPERPNSTRPPNNRTRANASRFANVNPRTHCLVHRTRLIPPTHQAGFEVRPIDGIDSCARMAAE